MHRRHHLSKIISSFSSYWGGGDFTVFLVALDEVETVGGGHVGQSSAFQGPAFFDSHGHLAAWGLCNVGHLHSGAIRNLASSAAILGRAVGCVLPGDLAVSRLSVHHIEQADSLGGNLTALGASDHTCLAIGGLLTVSQEKTQRRVRGTHNQSFKTESSNTKLVSRV